MIEAIIYVLLGISVIIPLYLTIYIRRYASSPITVPYQVLMCLISLWALLYFLDLVQAELVIKIQVQELRFLVIPYVPVTILWMFLVIIDKKDWISGWKGILLLVVPISSSVLAITSLHHQLFRYDYWITYSYGIPILEYKTGLGFAIYSIYSYALVLTAVFLLLYYGEKLHEKYRKQQIILASLQIVGIFFSILYSTDFNLINGLNLTPVYFGFVGIIYYLVITRYGFIDLVPVARTRIIESLSSPLFILNDEGRIVDLNKAASRILQKSSDQLIGKDICDATADWLEFCQFYRDLPDQPTWIMKQDGEVIRTFSGKIDTLLSSSGNARGRIIQLDDVSELYQYEDYIEKQSHLTRQLLHKNSLQEKMYLVTDAVVDFFYADYACIWMIESGDLCGTECSYEPGSKTGHCCSDNRCCLHLVASSGKFTHLNWDHARIPLGDYNIGRIASGKEDYFVTNDVLHDPFLTDENLRSIQDLVSFSGFKLSRLDGTAVGVLALFSRHQITEHEISKLLDIANITSMVIQTGLAEQSLLESEKKFSSIFRETPDAILIINRELQILEVNQKFKEIFGYDEQISDIQGLFGNIIIDDPSVLEDLLLSAFDNDAVTSKELIFTNRSGVPFVAEVSASPVIIHRSPCLMIQIHDIDEIRRAYDAVSQANHKLNILSSVTRHDILNRIMIMSSYSEVLLEKEWDPVEKKQINAINQASKEIENLVGFTAFYQDLGTHAPTWQNLTDILQKDSVRNVLGDVNLSTNLNDLEIYADSMLEKVMYNLIDNSKWHGKNLTSIEILAHRERDDLLIIYEDDGGGIPDSEKNRVFEKGFGKNTGLGLFLIKEILSITGMSITENGLYGKGVRFIIRVPPGKFRKNS